MTLRVALPISHTGDTHYNQKNQAAYVEALGAVGLEAVSIGAELSNTEIAQIAATCQGVLLPGSPADVDPEKYGAQRQAETAAADPKRDNIDELLIQDAHNLYKPILAICYGLQTLNVWRSGTLVQHLPATAISHQAKAKLGRAHEIDIEAGSALAEIFGAENTWTNSSHHQAIDRAGDGLRVVARCADDEVIEAVEGENPEHFVVGVQWHPERSMEEGRESKRLFAAFAAAVRAWKPRAVRDSVARQGR